MSLVSCLEGLRWEDARTISWTNSHIQIGTMYKNVCKSTPTLARYTEEMNLESAAKSDMSKSGIW